MSDCECEHNHITMEIHLPSRGKYLFFGVAFNDDHVDEQHTAMWWDDTLGRLKQTALETLEREGVLESIES